VAEFACTELIVLSEVRRLFAGWHLFVGSGGCDMRRAGTLAIIVGGLMACAWPVQAAPMTHIDWKQLEDAIGDKGDHVVGEELCARPVTPRSGNEVHYSVTHYSVTVYFLTVR
jgi:hypothetical protein